MDFGNNTYCKQEMSPTYSVMSGFRYGESSSDLPPTPPSNAHDINHSLSSPSRSIIDKVSASSVSLKLPIRTFSHHRNPPTPDNTPPRGLDFYGRSPSSSRQLNYASSRAESFTTAREHPFSSQVDIGTSLSEHDSSSRVNVVDHDEDVNNMLVDSASEPQGEDNAAERQIKDEATLNHQENQSALFSKNSEVSLQSIHRTNTFIDSSYSPFPQHEKSIHEPRINVHSYSTPRKSALTPDGSPHSAKISEARLLNDDLGRISATSASSSVVQAVVLDASPRQRHSLRHAGRNLAYRLSNDTTPDSPLSRRRSSKESRVHHLSHKNQEIPREGLNIYNDLNTQYRSDFRIVSDPEPKQSAPSPYSMRYSAPKLTNADLNTLPNIRQIPFASSTRSRVISAPDGDINNFKRGGISSSRDPTTMITYGKQNSYQIPRKRVNSSFRSPANSNLTKDAREESSIQRNVSNSSQENGYLTRASSTGASSLRQKLQSGRSGDAVQEINVMQDIAVRSGSNGSTLNMISPVRNSQASGSSSERQQIEEATRSGLIRSGSGAYRLEPRRRSSDRFSAKIEEHAMARHLYPQGTPFSHITDSQDALEVSEATAVSIFPHNNHSLLVVQQMARSMPGPRSEPMSLIPDKSTQVEINLHPATPPEKASESRPSSPLENPRKPPEPPAFQVIPPTPCQEADREHDTDPKADDFPAPPPRRLSLIKRARRYSDTFIQPILTQTIPTRRNASQPISGKTPTRNENQKNKLHPFWRPRGFWDEFDSDSDADNHEVEGEDDRLPPGGDTSNAVDNDAKPKRRLTFRGTGGFLIGNTLGVTRAGTNIRRHHISLPARLAAKQQQQQYQQRQSRESARDSSDDHQGGNKGSGTSSLGYYGSGSQSTLMLRRNHGRIYKIPGLGIDFQYIGMSGMRTLMAAKRRKRERRKTEERRDRLRQSIIGPRVSV